MYKDRFGQELQVGDKVVTMRKGYRELVNAKIIKFTPEYVRVEYKTQSGKWTEEYLVDPRDVIKRPVQ
jgi:hypothetical protein